MMANVFTATKKTQGQRTNDFCWVPEGEIVGFAFECDSDKNNIDGGCGCRRSMSGLDCLKATTTFEVTYIPNFGPKALAKYVLESMESGGWLKFLDPDEAQEIAEQDAAELLRMASKFPVGAVVEKRGDVFQQRGI